MESDMKQMIIILAVLLALGSPVGAQIVQENEAAILYYMPQNEVSITLHYDVIEEQPGKFYQYADRYLGTKKVITEAKTIYSLTGISTQLLSKADANRAYKVAGTSGINEQLISLSKDGRWIGYNLGNVATELEADEQDNMTISIAKNSESICALMPLLEEQFMASSVAKMAEGAAKQIYHIRETRLNLLAGDVEHVPADGEAMKLVLAELDKQEQMLTELFIGKRSIEHKSHTLSYLPEENTENTVLCRFSVHTGVVGADDLSGEPIYMNVKAKKQELGYVMDVTSKGSTLSQLYYNLPGEGTFSISYKNQEVVIATYPIAQWGVAVALSKQLFGSKRIPTIHINPETGNILSIQL